MLTQWISILTHSQLWNNRLLIHPMQNHVLKQIPSANSLMHTKCTRHMTKSLAHQGTVSRNIKVSAVQAFRSSWLRKWQREGWHTYRTRPFYWVDVSCFYTVPRDLDLWSAGEESRSKYWQLQSQRGGCTGFTFLWGTGVKKVEIKYRGSIAILFGSHLKNCRNFVHFFPCRHRNCLSTLPLDICDVIKIPTCKTRQFRPRNVRLFVTHPSLTVELSENMNHAAK